MPHKVMISSVPPGEDTSKAWNGFFHVNEDDPEKAADCAMQHYVNNPPIEVPLPWGGFAKNKNKHGTGVVGYIHSCTWTDEAIEEYR